MTSDASTRGSELLQLVGARGKVQLCLPCGSRLYDLTVASSDEDWFVVYAGWSEDLLSVGKASKPALVLYDEKKDVAVKEVEHVLQLLLEGKTAVVEALYTDHLSSEDFYETDHWRALKARRHQFLTKHVWREYIGYVTAQFRQLDTTQEPSRRRKKVLHIMRLLLECERLAAGDVPQVRVTGHHRDELLRIRTLGEDDLMEVVGEADTRLKALLAAPPELPAEVDPEVMIFLNHWLRDVRLNSFQKPLPLRGISPNIVTSSGSSLPLFCAGIGVGMLVGVWLARRL